MKSLNDLIKELAPFLKGMGYKKNKSSFLLEGEEVTYLIEFQESNYGGNESSFTINVGIYIPQVIEIFACRKVPKKPVGADCPLLLRVGFINSTHDKWWSVKDGVEAEIKKCIESDVNSFFSFFKTKKDVANYICTESRQKQCLSPTSNAYAFLISSIIYFLDGDIEKMRIHQGLAVECSKGNPSEDVVTAVISRCI